VTRLDDTCRGCKAAIRWAVVEPSGKRMPLDPGPDADGNVYTVHASPLTVRVIRHSDAVPAGVKRWMPHFRTCPERTRRKPRQPKPQQVELALADEEAG
jgi:hypothetical protein